MASNSDPSSSSSSKPPQPRRTSHPKSTRQQFSACGACRIRRVRCDLKDLPEASACSNCQEHGFNCVDEYRDVKAVKMTRRGRRIQQVEAVYGQGASQDVNLRQSPASPSVRQSIIPRLDPQFLNSRFYARFHIQRPIIEPEEFKTRYTAFYNGSLDALGIPGQLIAMLLVIWAASYGVDHCGNEDSWDGFQGIQLRKQRTNAMIQELLYLIDVHGILRKPSWDGVRVLLLAMPLTEEVADPLERLTMYEAAINQVYTLCSLPSSSGHGEEVDVMVRARIYWYAFVHEGITTGLRGGRLHLEDEDLAMFQNEHGVESAVTRSEINISYTRRWALAPLRLASACRQINAALTGSKARARPDIDEAKLKDAWESMENCWEEFESLRQLGLLGILTKEEADRFVDGWKIFLFECHNVIREYLKGRLLLASGEGDTGFIVDVETRQTTYSSLARLHAIAEAKCRDVAQHVVSLVCRHLGTSFFAYDASLVRDGCFFAGYTLLGDEGSDEQSEICLRALSEMRWAFSKSEERIQTLRMIWETKKTSLNSKVNGGVASSSPAPSPPEQGHYPHHPVPDQRSAEYTMNHSTLTTPSPPGAPPVSYIVEGDHPVSYNAPSVSSGSSTFSTGSPYSPTAVVSAYNPPLHVQDSKPTASFSCPTDSNNVPIYHDPNTQPDEGTYLANGYLQDVKFSYHNIGESYMTPNHKSADGQSSTGQEARHLQLLHPVDQNQHSYNFSYQPPH